MNPPLIIKFRTRDQFYVYDVATGAIIEVNHIIYSIADDFHRIPLEEIIRQYSMFTSNEIMAAYAEMEENQKTNHFLTGHFPACAEEIGEVVFQKKRFALEEFLKMYSSMIILGITERCNLRCEYCCYSGQFEGWRSHGTGSMLFDIAKKAIDEHLRSKQPDNLCAVSFYGGEPLLEFALLKHAVLYAESESLKHGRKPMFTITTNGTLLNDEIIHFLVEHEFLIMISLDGPKDAHDRYRVFAGNEKRLGSFDIVMKNIRRFVDLYPEYRRRGLSMTLAPPILWKETKELVQNLFPSFPLTRVSMVNINGRKEARSCSEQCDCQKSHHSVDLEMSTEDEVILQTEFDKYQEALYRNSVEELLQIMPFHSLLFSPALRAIHERLVTSRPLPNTFIVPCMPGYSRRFCDIHGNYYLCERVDNSMRYLLGNAETGYDVQAASKLIRWFNETTDCGNCVSMKTCNLCYAAIPLADSELPLIKNQMKHSCCQLRDTAPIMLRKYVEIMERNPNAFDSDEGANDNNPLTFLPKYNH